MVSDRLFTYDMVTAVRLQAAATTSPVYYYYFSYRGAHSKSEVLANSEENYGIYVYFLQTNVYIMFIVSLLGTSHGDDTVYVLSSVVDMLSTAEDRNMSTLLLDLWTSYADTG